VFINGAADFITTTQLGLWIKH